MEKRRGSVDVEQNPRRNHQTTKTDYQEEPSGVPKSSPSPKARARTNSYAPNQTRPKLSQQRQRSRSFGHASFLPIERSNEDSKTIHIGHSNGRLSPSNSFSSSEMIFSHVRSNYNNSALTGGTHHLSEKSTNDLVFDYIHGEIKHRPKTAFGSKVHEDIETKASCKLTTKVVADPCESDKEDEENVDNLIKADDFINRCIIESEQPVIKPTEKPHSSATFDKILKEFMSDSSADSESEMDETERVFRLRANSLPVSSMLKANQTVNSGGKRVHIQLPEI